MTPLNIKANNVFLRPLSDEDAVTLFSYRSKPEVAKFQLWKPVKIADAISFINKAKFQTELINHQWNQFAICLDINKKMVGDIGLLLNDHKAEIGFTINPLFQRKGFAFDAVTGLINYLFDKHIVDMIVAYTDPENAPSIMLLKKIGFCLDRSNSRNAEETTDYCFILNKDFE